MPGAATPQEVARDQAIAALQQQFNSVVNGNTTQFAGSAQYSPAVLNIPSKYIPVGQLFKTNYDYNTQSKAVSDARKALTNIGAALVPPTQSGTYLGVGFGPFDQFTQTRTYQNPNYDAQLADYNRQKLAIRNLSDASVSQESQAKAQVKPLLQRAQAAISNFEDSKTRPAMQQLAIARLRELLGQKQSAIPSSLQLPGTSMLSFSNAFNTQG